MKQNFLIALVFTFAMLAGCSPVTQALPSPTPSIATAIPSTSTVTPVATSTSYVVPEETNMLTSTPTLIPTLPPETAKATIFVWLENNGNCELPCLWGIEPGKTTLQTWQKLLASFGRSTDGEKYHIVATSNNNEGSVGYVYSSGADRLAVILKSSEKDGQIKSLHLYTDVFYNDIRSFVNSDYKKLTQYYINRPNIENIRTAKSNLPGYLAL